MKKYIYISILLLVSISCKPQNKELQEAQIELEENIQGITSMLNFMDSSVSFGPADQESNDSLTKFDFRDAFGFKDTTVIKQKIETYLDSLKFYETIQYPSNYLELDYYNNNLGDIFGYFGYFTDRKKEEPVFLLKKVFFKDKTEVAFNDTIYDISETSSNIGVLIKSSKPVNKLGIDVHYQYPFIEKFSLGKNNTIITLPEGEIILKRIEKNEVTLIMPAIFKERLVDMNAIYKDGRILERKGMSGNTLPSKEKLEFFKELLNVKKTAVAKLKNNEFEDKATLTKFIEEKTPAQPEEKAPLFTATYYFSGNVSSINLFIKKEQNIFSEKNIEIETGAYRKEQENKLGYYIATDSVSGKDGLVGIDGNWKVQPDFEDLHFYNNFFYRGTHRDDLNQLYHLSINQNKLDRAFLDIQGTELHHDNLVIIRKTTNHYGKLFGVINAENYRTIIPNNYYHIKVKNGFFIVENLERNEGVYDKNGKQILPEFYDSIDVENGLFIVKNLEGKEGLYDKNGKQILLEIYDYINIKEGKIYAKIDSEQEVFNLKGVKLKDK